MVPELVSQDNMMLGYPSHSARCRPASHMRTRRPLNHSRGKLEDSVTRRSHMEGRRTPLTPQFSTYTPRLQCGGRVEGQETLTRADALSIGTVVILSSLATLHTHFNHASYRSRAVSTLGTVFEINSRNAVMFGFPSYTA